MPGRAGGTRLSEQPKPSGWPDRTGQVLLLVSTNRSRDWGSHHLETPLLTASPFPPRDLTKRDYDQAATTASATAWSCLPLPPLTPTTPAIWPFTLIGMPRAKIITRAWFETWIPKNWSPGWLLRPSSSVEISKAFAVKALLMAMSMLPSHAPSMRAKAVRFAPASTTAIFIGWPISFAFMIPAPTILCAFSIVIMSVELLAATFRCLGHQVVLVALRLIRLERLAGSAHELGLHDL